MMASPTSPPWFTCQHTCLFPLRHRHSIHQSPSSRRTKKGLRGSGPFRINRLLGICGSTISGSPPVDPSVPRARRVRSCVKTPRRPSFARQLRQLGGPVHLCLSARGPNFGALPLGWGMGRGRASAVGAAGFWGGWGGCWGAASAGDVAIAPFLLIPSSIQGEEAHSHQGHRGNHQVQTLQTSVQASYTIPNQLHPITPLPVPIYPIPSQHPIPSTYSTTNLPSPVNV